MVDKFIYPDLTENTAPLGSDAEVMEDDPNGTPLSQYIYKGSSNLLPDGYLINGKISVTVASNNITVAIKTKSGGNPSATDPVSVWINGSYRRITAALGVTKNAGTNWFASGATELATKEIDYFVYLIWNTTPATDIMDIGFARIPFGRVYSDFSGTTTNEKYLAFGNASTPTSTDDCIVVGRFAATLSATASFNWSVPTFTGVNLIHRPIWNTRTLTWGPVVTSGTGTPTTTVPTCVYMFDGLKIIARGHVLISNKGTAAGSMKLTPPFTLPDAVGYGQEAVITGAGAAVVSLSNVLYITKYDATTPWTNTWDWYFQFQATL